jgi:hypothetical protein
MFTKKMDVLMIRSRFQGVDLNGIRSPVLKKQPEGFFGKFSRDQSFHELRAAHPLLPTIGDLPIKPIDVSFGFLAIHFNIHGGALLPSPFPLPQAGESKKKENSADRKIPSPIPMGEGEGEGSFVFWS